MYVFLNVFCVREACIPGEFVASRTGNLKGMCFKIKEAFAWQEVWSYTVLVADELVVQ
jgi:hypothetical protein